MIMEKDIGRIKKNDNTDIVIRIDDFGGKPGITIREYVTGDRYTGFTKSGTRIPFDDFEDFKKLIISIKKEDYDFSQSAPEGKESAPVKKKVSKTEDEEDDSDTYY